MASLQRLIADHRYLKRRARNEHEVYIKALLYTLEIQLMIKEKLTFQILSVTASICQALMTRHNLRSRLVKISFMSQLISSLTNENIILASMRRA